VVPQKKKLDHQQEAPVSATHPAKDPVLHGNVAEQCFGKIYYYSLLMEEILH